MTPDEVSEKLCPMGFKNFGDGDTWYLPKNGNNLAGMMFLSPDGRYRARILQVRAATVFDCPIAAAVWLLTEVNNG